MSPARTKSGIASERPTGNDIRPNDKLLMRIKSIFNEVQHVAKPRLSENMSLEDRRREMVKYEECVAEYIAQLRRQFDKVHLRLIARKRTSMYRRARKRMFADSVRHSG